MRQIALACVAGQRHCPSGRGIRPVLPPGVLKQQLMLVRRLSTHRSFNRAEVSGVEIVAGAGFQATIAHHMAYQAAQKAIDEIGWNVSHGFHSHSDTCGD